MSETIYVCRCGGSIRFVELAVEDVPPPPSPLLAIAQDGGPPPGTKGWDWICLACGEKVGFTYDYGTLDLGLVRDEQLADAGDFEIFGEPPA